MNIFKKIVALLIIINIGACTTLPESDSLSVDGSLEVSSDQVVCGDARPLMCTREYNPVCAIQKSPKGDPVYVTYATGCTACADIRVISYQPAACE